MEGAQSKVKEFQKRLESQLLTNIYPSPSDKLIKTKSRKPVKPTKQNLQEIALHAQPSEGNLENMVNHEDGRKPVKNPAKWPNSVHGVVSAKFEGIEGATFGTGTLIGPNIVLTAGHNLYNQTKKVYAQLESIQFLPGIDVQMLPFGIAEVELFFISPRYVKEGREDYGILILKEPVGEVTGYFGLVCLEPEELTGKMINVTGYPRDKVKSKPHTYEMWGMEGPAAYIDKHKGLIQYAIDAAGGQSGSGVWYQEGEDFYVCGVHVAGFSTYNQATLLTKDVYQQIHIWLQKIPDKRLLLCPKRTEFKLNRFPLDTECLSFLMAENLDLTAIHFFLHTINTKGAAILAQNTSWVNLSFLDLSENDIDDKGAVALGRNTSWVNLSHLDLGWNNIGDQGAAALARNTSWVKLSFLRLRKNNIFSQGAAALAQNTSWVHLQNLDLTENQIGSHGAAELAQNTSWVNLSKLFLSSNSLGDQGAAALAKNNSWVNLSFLFLRENKIFGHGALRLAQNTSWVHLQNLDLRENYLGDKGAVALAQNTSWVNLSGLNLSHNSIGSEGVFALTRNPCWKYLFKTKFVWD